MPQLQVLVYFKILLRAGCSLSCLQAAMSKQSRQDRSILFSDAWLRFLTLLEYPLPQTWLLNPVTADGDSLCVMATSWIQLFAMQSPVPSSFTQLRRAQSSSIPRSVTGEEAEPQTQFHTILAQHTRDDSKTKARATTYSDFSYCLMTMSLPQSQVPEELLF